MRRNSVNPASGLKTALAIVFSEHDFYKRTKIVAIWQHYKRVLSIFSPRMHRNGYLWTSNPKSDPAIRSGDLDFLYYRCISTTSDVYWIYLMFFATTLHDLVTSTFDLLTLRVFRVKCFSCPTHIPIFIILRLSVTELRVLTEYLITFPLYETVTAHAPCYVTSNRGRK